MQPVITAHGLQTFDAWWDRHIDWFEAPNARRGGWSGVGKLVLAPQSGPAMTLFVKKQHNHGRRTWRHPWAGEPTFRREFERLQSLAQAGIGAPKVLLYGESRVAGDQRAILVTENLHGLTDLEQALPGWVTLPQADRRQRLRAVAQAIRRFHDHGWVHRALYPKHIFVTAERVNPSVAPIDLAVALIDLEKTRQIVGRWRRAHFDLSALHRHTEGLSDRDRLYFFKQYVLANATPQRLSAGERRLLKRIIRRSKR